MPTHKFLGLTLGICIAFCIWISPAPEGLSNEAWTVAGLALLMAIWWASEAIPLAITALLPITILPLSGATSLKQVSITYASPMIYLLLGGFIIALALERWNLHKRAALTLLVHTTKNPSSIIGGFMLVTAMTSMWVSNTASTLMMIPIALSVVSVICSNPAENPSQKNFEQALLLGLAFSASIGGVGTLIGTPPNVLVAGYLEEAHGVEIGFATWAMVGLPLVALLLPLSWWILTRIAFPVSTKVDHNAQNEIQKALSELGGMTVAEKRLLFVFLCVATAWIFRPLLNQLGPLANLSDTTIALLGAITLFLTPSGMSGKLMNWEVAKKLPWDVLLLYSGSIALAAAVSGSGLATWLGDNLFALSEWHDLALIFFVVLVVLTLTELLNNSATVAALLPVIGALAVSREMSPLMLALPTAMAASCAFMLPVATPPNTIVYGTGRVSLASMVRGGTGINLIGLILIPLLAYALVPLLL